MNLSTEFSGFQHSRPLQSAEQTDTTIIKNIKNPTTNAFELKMAS